MATMTTMTTMTTMLRVPSMAGGLGHLLVVLDATPIRRRGGPAGAVITLSALG
jgi:hypothetical protein